MRRAGTWITAVSVLALAACSASDVPVGTSRDAAPSDAGQSVPISSDNLRCVSPNSQVTARSGTVRVPAITVGTSVDDALKQLSDAGLEGCTPQVDYPHYATGTDPAAGSTVSLGSRVTLQIGDG